MSQWSSKSAWFYNHHPFNSYYIIYAIGEKQILNVDVCHIQHGDAFASDLSARRRQSFHDQEGHDQGSIEREELARVTAEISFYEDQIRQLKVVNSYLRAQCELKYQGQAVLLHQMSSSVGGGGRETSTHLYGGMSHSESPSPRISEHFADECVQVLDGSISEEQINPVGCYGVSTFDDINGEGVYGGGICTLGDLTYST